MILDLELSSYTMLRNLLNPDGGYSKIGAWWRSFISSDAVDGRGGEIQYSERLKEWGYYKETNEVGGGIKFSNRSSNSLVSPYNGTGVENFGHRVVMRLVFACISTSQPNGVHFYSDNGTTGLDLTKSKHTVGNMDITGIDWILGTNKSYSATRLGPVYRNEISTVTLGNSSPELFSSFTTSLGLMFSKPFNTGYRDVNGNYIYNHPINDPDTVFPNNGNIFQRKFTIGDSVYMYKVK